MIPQKVSRLLSRRVLQYSSVSVRHHNFDGENPAIKTHMSMITREDESHNYIVGVSNRGIRLSIGISVLGPCAVFPRAVLHWNVASAENITPESLSLFCMLEPKLDLLIIGKGDQDAKVNNNIFKYLRSRKINVEILPTEQACSTFNFLNSERRVVAAAIIPPTKVLDHFEDETLSHLQLDDMEKAADNQFADIEEKLKPFEGKSFFALLEHHSPKRNWDPDVPQRHNKQETKSEVKETSKK